MIRNPNIFKYTDYRLYLRHLFDFKKSESPVFSHRYIIQKAGFKSPNYLKNVMDGKRNLSLEGANKFAQAFKIEGIKRHYFLTMVLFNQSKMLAEKEKYLKELMELAASQSPGHLKAEQMDILSDWWHLVIWEMVQLPDFKNSAKWVSRNLTPNIPLEKVSESFKLLKDLGLLERQDGKWVAKDQILETDDVVRSVKAAQYHRKMIQLGADSIGTHPSAIREISGTTISFNRADFHDMIGAIREFRKKLMALAANSSEPDQIYQFNLQFFPVVLPNRKVRSDPGEYEELDNIE